MTIESGEDWSKIGVRPKKKVLSSNNQEFTTYDSPKIIHPWINIVISTLGFSDIMPGPPPPPPPMMAPVKKFVPAPTSGGGDTRNALLGQIQQGAKLKKVQTVDKSKPIGVGKIAGEPAPSRGPRGPPSNKTSPDSSASSPARKPPGGFANLTDELQFKLTLKKNKTSPTKETKNVVEAKEVSRPMQRVSS